MEFVPSTTMLPLKLLFTPVMESVPPLTATGPLKPLFAESVQVPVPDLVRPLSTLEPDPLLMDPETVPVALPPRNKKRAVVLGAIVLESVSDPPSEWIRVLPPPPARVKVPVMVLLPVTLRMMPLPPCPSPLVVKLLGTVMPVALLRVRAANPLVALLTIVTAPVPSAALLVILRVPTFPF